MTRGAPARRMRQLLRGSLGILFSVAALALVANQIDPGKTASILAGAGKGWRAVVGVAVCVDLTFRAWRWQVLIEPVAHLRFRSVLGSLLVGYLANNVLPARLGELVRSHHLGDREGVRRATLLGTVVVERVVDTAVLVVIAAAAIVILNVRGTVANAVLLGLALSALLTAALVFAVVAHRIPGYARLHTFAERWPRLLGLVGLLVSGMRVAAEPRALVKAVLLSGAAWTVTVIAFAAAAQATGIELTTSQAALLAAGANLVTAIPAGPGNLGTFELAAVAILAVYGVPADRALAIAVIVHVAILAITSGSGVAAYLVLARPKAVHTAAET